MSSVSGPDDLIENLEQLETFGTCYAANERGNTPYAPDRMSIDDMKSSVHERLQHLRNKTRLSQRSYKGIDISEVLLGMVEAAPCEAGARYAARAIFLQSVGLRTNDPYSMQVARLPNVSPEDATLREDNALENLFKLGVLWVVYLLWPCRCTITADCVIPPHCLSPWHCSY